MRVNTSHVTGWGLTRNATRPNNNYISGSVYKSEKCQYIIIILRHYIQNVNDFMKISGDIMIDRSVELTGIALFIINWYNKLNKHSKHCIIIVYTLVH